VFEGDEKSAVAPILAYAELENNQLALLSKCSGLDDNWKELVTFKPPRSVIDRLESLPSMIYTVDRTGNSIKDPWKIQSIEGAKGFAINLDFFSVTINKLPMTGSKRCSADELLEFMRLNINDFVDSELSQFEPHPQLMPDELQRWQNKPFESIISISIPMDAGSVIVSDYKSNGWIFTTIHDPWNFSHPVSGNRQFGYQTDGNKYIFFTRGADRITTSTDEFIGKILAGFDENPIQFEKADELWKSFQMGIIKYVNENGGRAELGKIITNRPNWANVKKAIKENRSLTSVECN